MTIRPIRNARDQSAYPILRKCNSWRPLSLSRIQKQLGLSRAEIVLAEAKSFDFEIDAVSLLGTMRPSDHLRFCSICIRLGFHSALFQMPWIDRCPIHDEKIQDECPGCLSRISYRVDSEALSLAYGCPLCGSSLWPERDMVPQERGLTHESIAMLADWFFREKRKSSERFSHRFLFALERTPLQCDRTEKLVSLLPTRRQNRYQSFLEGEQSVCGCFR